MPPLFPLPLESVLLPDPETALDIEPKTESPLELDRPSELRPALLGYLMHLFFTR